MKNKNSIYNDGTYLENNADWHVADSPWKAEQIAKIIAKNKLEVSTICEAGCGAGEIVRQLSLKDAFSRVAFSGYEISNNAFDLCRARESDTVRYFHKDILTEDVFFDIVLCIDVFEHVDDYMGFLRKLRDKATHKIFHIPLDLSVSALLRKQMLVARESIGHLHYFSPETALATLKDCGYEVLDYNYTKSFSGIPGEKLRERVAKLPRHLVWSISPRLMSTLIGGASLMVLTK